MPTIRVMPCADSSQWAWALIDADGGVICDGDEATDAECWEKARKAALDFQSWLNGEGQRP